LYSSNGTTQLAISQAGGTASETITRTYTAGTYYVRVYGYNGANSATVCYTLRVALGTATIPDILIANSDKARLVLYPNPAQDKLNIYIANYDQQKVIEIFNINGQRVFMTKESENNSTFDISKLTGGLYLVKVSAPDGTLISQEKFVKQ
jgi:hypothetical protein